MKIIETNEGWQIIDIDSHVGAWIVQNKRLDHDEFLIPIAVANIPEDGIVIDCGALYGDHTIAYAKKVGGGGTVLAIEAGNMAYSCLMHNAKKFESTVYCIHAAVCQEHGGKAIHSVQDNGNMGASIVTDDETKGVEIRTISIDGLVKDGNFPRLDFIKIDCEGWEGHILRGARGAIKQFKPKMLIEINLGALMQQNDTDKDVLDLLLEMGYSWQIVQPGLNGSAPQYDILCWPNQVEIIEGRKVLDPKNENQ